MPGGKQERQGEQTPTRSRPRRREEHENGRLLLAERVEARLEFGEEARCNDAFADGVCQRDPVWLAQRTGDCHRERILARVCGLAYVDTTLTQ